MNAPQLLQTIEARGGAATLKRDESGAAKINVAPRSLALEFLPDLQRLKPELLALLKSPDGAAAPSRAPAPIRLLDELEGRGLRPTAEGGTLVFNRGELPVKLRAPVVRHMAALMALLMFRQHAETRRRREHWVCPDARLLELWREAEAATGAKLTIGGRFSSVQKRLKRDLA